MVQNTHRRDLAPTLVGAAASIVTFGLYQYYRISADYFTGAVAWVVPASIIIVGLLGLIAWGFAFYLQATQKGQSPYWAALAPLGPLGLIPLALIKDKTQRAKRYLRPRAKPQTHVRRAALRTD